MAIKSLRAVQDQETRMVTDFEVTFKLIRFASTQNSSASNSAGRALVAGTPTAQLGATAPTGPQVDQGSKIDMVH